MPKDVDCVFVLPSPAIAVCSGPCSRCRRCRRRRQSGQERRCSEARTTTTEVGTHFKQGFESAFFFADPDPGKNFHADPDPDPGGIRGRGVVVKGKNDFFEFFSRFR